MASCSDIATGAAPNDSTSLLKKVVQEVKLFISLHQSYRDMEYEVQRLNDLTDEINVELARVQLNPKRIVKAWLDKAREAIESSGSIRIDYEEHKNRVSRCPNCVCRYRIGRRIRDWKASVSQLVSQRQSDFPPSGEYGEPISRSQLQRQAEFVERLLTDEKSNIQRIGIIGMPGVGKTRLLDTINNNDKVKTSFELIIKLTVSRNDISSLQKCVAERLSLELPDYPEGRRDMLRNGLKNRRYLLLLDDMWAADAWTSDRLQELGVSLEDQTCKFVLTTRDEEVCAKMKVQKRTVVEREPLLGEECKGLEVALDVELFQHLKWSYDDIPADFLKICFLYFAAYPKNRVIYCEQLIDFWIAEGLVTGRGDSNLHDIGYDCIEVLADRCLIEEAGKDSVGRISSGKIHDMLRVIAIRIAVKEQSCHFKAGVGVSYFPSEEGLEGCVRMSLMRNDLHSLPTTFTCSSLTVLLLRENPGIKEVPESFLPQLPSLRVLDLSQTGITSVPPSIGDLKYLVCLNLSECSYICELPEAIGNLKELQFLNVSFCPRLGCLPRISELNRLRALDIRGCSRLSHLPRGISEVVSLERLRMLGSTIRLGFEEEAVAERQYACLKDLQTLSRLRVFSAEVKSPVKEGVMVKWSNMRDLSLRFEDANGEDHLPHDMQAMEDLESLSLWYFGVERLPSWVTQFRKLACLCLVGCKQLKELPAELPCVRVLWLDKCDKLKKLQLGMCFPKLQEMTLRNLESLECVTMATVAAASGSGGLGEGDWPMLKFLEVWKCSKLKTLSGKWDELKCLQEIRGQTEWWDAIQWEDPNMETFLGDKFNVYNF